MIEDHQQDTIADAGERQSRAPGPRVASALAAACALALVALVVLGVWLRGESSDLDAREDDRAAVMQAAERFTETWNTFQADDVEGYLKRVTPLLTTKFRATVTEGSEDVITGIEQQQLSSEGEVLVDGDGIPLVGISSLDRDSAIVLVVSDANRVASGQQVLRHWRWELEMRKVDGEWLVDDFKEV